ncbi:Hypothetical predicted protein [Olea europaea subsp. europaea]|uniref:Uncharacterized protein n=1 Tax=Olea europaea subsp. europaea TaxID=158383 RepID=A0A8S0SR00_OLEEU|nr:Hypothetical predicted protein [Olea europaea subsp. europaea]
MINNQHYNILALMQKEEIGRACESFKLLSLVSQGCKGQNLHLAGITTGAEEGPESLTKLRCELSWSRKQNKPRKRLEEASYEAN